MLPLIFLNQQKVDASNLNANEFYCCAIFQKERQHGCYKMENDPRGLGIIVTMTKDREGWDTDVLKLEEMFKYLNVETEYHFDLSSQVSTSLYWCKSIFSQVILWNDHHKLPQKLSQWVSTLKDHQINLLKDYMNLDGGNV